ncbi:MAG: acetate--CoA ligase family protein [Azonexus sp.]|jgi:acyl-CoA synthetase (NDP forming)|nr:acetate--CoA ligase family protein [Azonexus sp.]
MSSSRRLYRHADLDRILNPGSIAIVGASPRAGSFGERLQKNLADFEGRVFLVNAKYQELDGLPCYPSLSALPEVPDCVAITVPREAAEPAVREAGELGAGGVILYASGYAETGKPERVEEQKRLTALAREYKLRILGPNCLGIANYLRSARITFSEYPHFSHPQPESVGIASQSGALSQSLAQAIERGMSVSHAFSAGNQADVDVADLVAYLADEPSCRAIACVFEGMSNPERLIEAANIAWAADKPLVILKIATGEQGAAAAMSHTGSLAGSNAAYIAAFERAGAIVVDDFEALMETAAFFAKAPRPKARGVAVVATSGGAAIMAADKAEIHGIPLPQPKPEAMAILESHIPDFGSTRNPCDVTAQVMNAPNSLGACAEALMGDDDYGAIVLPQPVAFDFHTPRIKVFSDLSQRFGKITCNVLISDWLQGPASREAEMDSHVAMFRSMDRCFATLAAWHKREAQRSSPLPPYQRVAPMAAAGEAARLIDDASRHSTLTEREAKNVLALYGVPVVGESLVTDEEAAVDAARRLGYPLAMKIESPDIPHKTEAGVIALNLKSESEVRAAYTKLMGNALKVASAARVNGALLQPMLPPGAEIMVGARIDPLFGPLVVVSLGGILVELLKDLVVAQAPVSPAEARDMVGRLKGVAVLQGFRGSEPVDLDRLADIVARLSEFAADQQSRITELDVNPLICSGQRITAVDALIVRKSN